MKIQRICDTCLKSFRVIIYTQNKSEKRQIVYRCPHCGQHFYITVHGNLTHIDVFNEGLITPEEIKEHCYKTQKNPPRRTTFLEPGQCSILYTKIMQIFANIKKIF